MEVKLTPGQVKALVTYIMFTTSVIQLFKKDEYVEYDRVRRVYGGIEKMVADLLDVEVEVQLKQLLGIERKV